MTENFVNSLNWLTYLSLYTSVFFSSFSVTGGQIRFGITTKLPNRTETHAACVVYRRFPPPESNDSKIEYLLFHSSHGAYRWVFPKGQVKLTLNGSLMDALLVKLKENFRLRPNNELIFLPNFTTYSEFTVGGVTKCTTYYMAEYTKLNKPVKYLRKLHMRFGWFQLKDATEYLKFKSVHLLLPLSGNSQNVVNGKKFKLVNLIHHTFMFLTLHLWPYVLLFVLPSISTCYMDRYGHADTGYEQTVFSTKQVGWILYRNQTGKKEIEYLLLQAKHGGYRWILPKAALRNELLKLHEIDAALYKLQRNLGLNEYDVRVVDEFVHRTQFRVEGVKKHCTFFLAELTNPKPRLKHRISYMYNDHQWVGLYKGCRLLEFADMRDALISSSEYIKTLAW